MTETDILNRGTASRRNAFVVVSFQPLAMMCVILGYIFLNSDLKTTVVKNKKSIILIKNLCILAFASYVKKNNRGAKRDVFYQCRYTPICQHTSSRRPLATVASQNHITHGARGHQHRTPVHVRAPCHKLN